MTTAKDAATQAASATAGSLDSNPLAVLAGGIAAGVLAGALLPRSDRERELLRPVGAKLGAAALAAVAAAKEAGRAELDARGLTAEGARDRARGLFSDIAKAAATAGSAAAQSAKGAVSQDEPAHGAAPQAAPTPDLDPVAQTSGASGFNSGH